MYRDELSIEMRKHTESILIKKINHSDKDAFKELCEIYYEPVFLYIRKKVYDTDIAYDLTQDVFLSIWNHRKNLDPEHNIKAYIYKTATNVSINFIKKRSSQSKYIITNGEEILRNASHDSPRNSLLLEEAFNGIPENQKTIFILNKFEGFKYKEIAEMLDISVKTVESRMSKILRTLRNRAKYLLSLIFFILQ